MGDDSQSMAGFILIGGIRTYVGEDVERTDGVSSSGRNLLSAANEDWLLAMQLSPDTAERGGRREGGQRERERTAGRRAGMTSYSGIQNRGAASGRPCARLNIHIPDESHEDLYASCRVLPGHQKSPKFWSSKKTKSLDPGGCTPPTLFKHALFL